MSKKILIISDTHLGREFDRNKFLFLKQLFSSFDKIIINGDFWDFWLTNFDEFLKTKWQELFPLLKCKDCVYIYGNHDPKRLSDDRIRIFSNSAHEEFEFSFEGKKYQVCHGDRIVSENSVTRKTLNKIFTNIEGRRVDKPVYKLFKNAEKGGFKIHPNNMTNSLIGRNWNKKIKDYKSRNLQDRWLICGDTHTAEIDETSKYANSGCVIYGFGSFLILGKDGLVLKKENYR